MVHVSVFGALPIKCRPILRTGWGYCILQAHCEYNGKPFVLEMDLILTFTLERVRGDIRSLAPVFADYPCEEVNAKYESIRSPESHIQLHVSEPARDPALLSSFAL